MAAFTRSLLALLPAALVAASCAGDPGAGATFQQNDTGGRPERDTDDRDTGSDLGSDVPITGEAHLEYVTGPEIRVSFSATEQIAVRYVGADGAPIESATIEFGYDDVAANGTQLRAARSNTDADGVASVAIVGGTSPASFLVTAEVRDSDAVDPLEFDVYVAPKDSSDYIVQVEYGPDVPLQLDEVRLAVFDDGRTCEEIGADWLASTGAIIEETIPAGSDNTFDPYGYTRRIDDPFLTAAVAFAFIDDTQVGIGCNDGPFELPDGSEIAPPDVNIGQNAIIRVPVTELFPSIRGEYSVVNQFDVFEFLPPEVQSIVRYVGSFFESPGRTIFDILEDQDIFDISTLPFESAIIDLIDGLLISILPPEVQDVFRIGADINAALQDVKLQGRMIFFEDPDNTGRLAACNEIILDEIVVNFNEIETPPLNLASYGYQGAYGTFTGWISVVNDRGIGYQLNIEPYGLQINYGELALFIVEAVVLPELTDGAVDSLEGLVGLLVDCNAIATDIGWGPIEGICDAAIEAAVNGVRDFITQQTADVSSFYILSTPLAGSMPPDDVELLEADMVWEPCDLAVDLEGGDFRVTEMGGEGRERCLWDARFRTDPSDPAGRPVPAAFNGYEVRQTPGGACGDGR